MTVTYNGSSINTGTMYEDGTIKVKNGFSYKESQGSSIKNSTVDSARIKNKILSKTINFEPTNTGMIKDSSISSARIKAKILNKSFSEIEGTKVSLAVIDSARMKLAIITP